MVWSNFFGHIEFLLKKGMKSYQRIKNTTCTNVLRKESVVFVEEQERTLITSIKRWVDGNVRKLIIQNTLMQDFAESTTRKNIN